MSLLSSPSTSSSPVNSSVGAAVNSSLLGGADNNKEEEEEVATLHESFTYHTVARYELSIDVRLAPSCRRSCIVVNVGKVESGNVGGNAANANANANGSAMYSQGGVKQVLDLSKEEDEVNASVDTTVDDSIVRNASKKRGRPRRVTPEDSTTTTESVRKSRRVHINQTVTRRSNRRRMNQVVSSDESEEDHAVVMSDDVKPARPPIAVRRSGRTCIPSKRSLFSIDEELEDVSPDDNSPRFKSKSSQCKTSRANNITTSSNKGTTRQNNQLHYTPAFTRSMSSQSNDSMCTYTGDICLDGGKMKVETIVKHLTRGLPTVDAVLLYDGETYSVVRHDDKTKKSLSSTIETIDEIENDYLDEPIGKAFRSYTAEKRPMTIWDSGGIEPPSCQEEEDAAFVLSLADMRYDNDARRYHDEVEKLAPWWIETADCVHMGSTGGINDRGVRGGHWKVLYLFERHAMKPSHPVRRFGQAKPIRGKASKAPPTLKYSLAGYMTILFHQKRMVVCQVLILPPYQRSGHGLNLMRAAYESLAFGNMITDPISEINVELPGKAFVCLRDKIDYHFVRHFMTDTFTKRNLWDVSDEYTEPVILSARGKASLNVLPDEVIEKMSTSLKITLRQCQIAYEIWLLGKIEEFIKSKLGNSDVSELNKQIATLEGSYKFIVKRSLLRVLREKDERFNCLCIEEQQEKLEDSFVSTVCHYRTFL
jgi:hypothetical protein